MPNKPTIYRPHQRPAPLTPRATAAMRGYGSRWNRARLSFLDLHPCCAECEREGRDVEAKVVDHVVPHKGDQDLFWDEANWQALCKPCHDSKTANEDGGFGRTPTTRGQ